MTDDPNPPNRARLVALPVALFVVVVGIVLSLAFTHPAQPGIPKDSGAPVALGNAASGHTIFNATCAGCHGQDGTGGGIGPTLKGANVSLARAKGIIDAGSGAMPAGLVSGARQADVLAYLNSIFAGGGGQAAPPPPPPPPPTTSSTADSAADRGHAIFNDTCAGCHGKNGSGGGIGPKLQGADVTVDQARQIINAGSGPMPPKLVTGARQQEVLAYLATIFKGGQTTTTPPPTGSTASPPITGGSAQLLGADFTKLRIVLAGPSPKAWTVWAKGTSGLRRIGALPAGTTRRTLTAPAAVGSLLEGYDQIVIGADADQPALVTELRPQVVDALRSLLVTSSVLPSADSLRTAAAGQLSVLLDHVRFLQQAQAERNIFNVRLHGEHLVNIVNGNPIVDLDGNGQASNPGDGIGLIGQPNGYLQRERDAVAIVGAGNAAAPSARTAATRFKQVELAEARLLVALAAQARVSGATKTLDRSRVPVATVARLAQQARRQQAAAARQLPHLATFALHPPTR